MVVQRRKADYQGERGNSSGTLMVPVTGDRKGEGEAMECDRFLEGKMGRKRGGSTLSEADNTTKSDAAAGVCRSKMTKENWVGGLDARLGRTADHADEKIWLIV
jgi:hypothetical protein